MNIKQYLTPKNIVIAVMALALLILLIILFSGNKNPKDNSTAIDLLENDLQVLQDENKRLESEVSKWQEQATKSRERDSVLLVRYEQRIWQDQQTISKLKKQRDEKKIVIDTATDSLLHRLLAE